MSRPKILIVNVATGEEIFREFNDEEYAQHLIDVDEYKKIEEEKAIALAKEKAKQAAKVEALAALGLSQEVINLLAE